MMKRVTVAALVTGGVIAGAVGANALTQGPAGPFHGPADLEPVHWRGEGWHKGMMGPRGRGPMRRMMREADADGDGALTREEVDAWIAARVGAGDADEDGDLTLAEFETIWLELTRPRMVDTFQMLDDDGDAVVSAAEIDERIGALFARADRNEDGVIDRSDRGRRWGRRGDDDRPGPGWRMRRNAPDDVE